ncbi:MAG: hypothetical protein KDC36_05390 [Thermoleophilia bacterium]|nr:hypothetical protein [Thermoleophilia bacterium]
MSSATPSEDPTLATLVPASSAGRNIVLIVGAIVTLAVVAWLGAMAGTRPWAQGAGMTLLNDGRVALGADVVTPRFAAARLDEVVPAEGTTLEHVWVLTDADPNPLDGASFEKTLAVLEEDRDRADRARATLPGGHARIVMTLRITDCAAARRHAVAAGAASTAAATVVVAMPFGGVAHVPIDWGGWTTEDLAAAGCS